MVICFLFDNQGKNVELGLTFWHSSTEGLAYFLFCGGCLFVKQHVNKCNPFLTYSCDGPFMSKSIYSTVVKYCLREEEGKRQEEKQTKDFCMFIKQGNVKPGQMKWLYPFFHLKYLHKPLKIVEIEQFQFSFFVGNGTM